MVAKGYYPRVSCVYSAIISSCTPPDGLLQMGRMKYLGVDLKQNMGVRMDGSMFDG